MTKLQCGWEDDCTEDDCHHCPRKHKITIEVTHAELTCVEECGVVDLPKYQKEKPERVELMQNVMMDLSKKMFEEIE